MENYIFVKYELFGKTRNIIFDCDSQVRSWETSLEALNDNEATNFKIIFIEKERY